MEFHRDEGMRVDSPERLRSWFELRAVSGLGDTTLVRLVCLLGSAERVRGAECDRLIHEGQVAPALAKAIRVGPSPEEGRAIDREILALSQFSGTVLTVLDDAYPAQLKTIADPPPLLYCTGASLNSHGPAIAVVGSRRVSPAGRAITERLSRELAGMGFTIVSGLARGVDGAAHRGALAGSGPTVAVLGCGVDRTYPPEHRDLRGEIEAHGTVLTECAWGAPPHAYHFPKRNRIISGLSLGVLVTEATLESGSLITARLAMEQGREVFAVPGSITEEGSRGPHSLIKQGAKLVERVEDVLEELIPQLDATIRQHVAQRPASSASGGAPLTPEEQALVSWLNAGPTALDFIIEKSGLPAAVVGSGMMSLELKGIVKQLPGQLVVRL
jgi:DNA processing protein